MTHLYWVWLACLVALQYVVNATLQIIDPVEGIIDTFTNTEATEIDGILKGYVELANPPDACTNLAFPTVPTNVTMKKMVLVNGTNECGLLTKLQNVAVVGYDVAIVYNPFPELLDYNITFPIPKFEVNVNVVVVLYEDGILIKNNYLFHNLSDEDKVVIQIIPAETKTIFRFIGFFTPCVIWIVLLFNYGYRKLKIYCNRNNNEHAHLREHLREEVVDHPQRTSMTREEYEHAYREGRLGRLSRSFDKKYRPVKFSTDDRFDMCAVCFESLVDEEDIRVLPCNHVYHRDCIDPWVLEFSTKERKCPLCSRKIMFQNSLEEYNSVATEVTPLLGSSCPPSYVLPDQRDILPGAQGSINR